MSGLYSYTENTFINKKHKRIASKLRSNKYLQIHYLPFAFSLMWNCPHAHTCAHKREKQAHQNHIYMTIRKMRNRHIKVRFQAIICPKHNHVSFIFPYVLPIYYLVFFHLGFQYSFFLLYVQCSDAKSTSLSTQVYSVSCMLLVL